MADQPDPKRRNASGISAAAIEGAREGEAASEKSLNPDDIPAKLAQPAPGMTNRESADETPASVSSTNEYTGITGGITEDQDDEDQEWRRAGGSSGDDADETVER
jgi:hypothetical protein